MYKKWVRAKGTSQAPYLYEQYKFYRSKLRDIIRQSKVDYFTKQFKKHSGNMRKSWNIVNQIRCKMKKLTSPTYLDFNGKLITNRRDIACHFNKYFTGIAHQLNIDKYGETVMDDNGSFKKFLKNRISSTMFFTDIDSNEIQSVISKLNDTKSSDFSVRAIKIVKHQISPLLATLFNDCMYSGTFPDELKLAKVLPLYKGGKTHIMSNYRPISILPLFSKIFEKLIYTRLYNFLEQNNILYNKQFGFRRQHSTSHALNIAVSTITRAMDSQYKSLGIFIDFSKAFDTINHSILISKLEHYGIRGQVLSFLSNYLSNRYQYVVCDGSTSTVLPISSGVPQGSVLGPLLFILYVNDIMYCACTCEGSHCNNKCKGVNLAVFILFADDTNIFISDTSIRTVYYKADYVLKHLSKYLDANYLHINLTKSKFIHFKSPRSNDINMNLNLYNKPLTCVKRIKFLGVLIDEKLNWKFHIDNIAKKVSRTSGVLYKIGRSLPKTLLPSIFSALVNSHLSYCISVWGGNATQLIKLFKAQKKALRSLLRIKRARKIHGIWKYGNTKPYFNDNEFLTVHNIFTYNTIIESFKILKSKKPLAIYHDLYSISHLNDLRLNTPSGRLECYSKNYYYRSPLLWNTFINAKIIEHFSLNINLSYLKRCLKLFLLLMQKEFDTNNWHNYNTDFISFITYKSS